MLVLAAIVANDKENINPCGQQDSNYGCQQDHHQNEKTVGQ